MKHVTIFTLMLLCAMPFAFAQSATLQGRITHDGDAVPFASIGVRGTAWGTSADLEGRYRLSNLQPGTYTLIASAVGFEVVRREVVLRADETIIADFELQETVIQSEGVVVTGTMMETFVDESPVKVTVVSPRYLEKVPTTNVMEVIENINGVYQQIDCGVCGTNNIRINGMDGPYTAVLIDGMPIMSSLATVYGLNGISPMLMQQIEVVKGPISTLYGSEAMGGVINIITKRAQTAPRVSVNSFTTSDREYALDAAIVPTRGRFSTLLSATLYYNNVFHDDNGDDFADITLNKRASFFGKASLTRADGQKQFDLSARYYFEDRIGGTTAFIDQYSEALRGSDELYGETIRTHRYELVGSYHVLPERGVKFDVAFNHHDQDSFYGADAYAAKQTTYFGQLLWPQRLSKSHALLFGAALRAQRYDDNTGSTGTYSDDGTLLENRADNRVIPGVFVQHEAVPSELVSVLSGMRVDYQKDHGFIAAPRVSLKVQPHDYTTLRLNSGTGFRIVNLFTEDHAAYTGARATVVLEDLKPERSVSTTLGLQQILPLGISPLTIELDGFYTYFTNKIEPDYSVPGQIRYENLSGSATTRGVSLTLSQNFGRLPLNYTLGGTFMDVFVDEDGTRSPLEFAPDFQGVANITYTLPRDFQVDYTMNLTGPMKLPEYDAPFERPSTSPTFSIHNLQVGKIFEVPDYKVQTYLAVKNLFDYTQPSPLIDPFNPFGENFDTAYVYAPIHGRHFGLGLRMTLLR